MIGIAQETGINIIFETVSSTKVVMKFYGVSMTSIYSNINQWIHIIHTIETFTDKSNG